MARFNDEGWWEAVDEPQEDEDGFDCVEPQLVGSLPLSAWDVMLLRMERVSGAVDLEMEYLR